MTEKLTLEELKNTNIKEILRKFCENNKVSDEVEIGKGWTSKTNNRDKTFITTTILYNFDYRNFTTGKFYTDENLKLKDAKFDKKRVGDIKELIDNHEFFNDGTAKKLMTLVTAIEYKGTKTEKKYKTIASLCGIELVTEKKLGNGGSHADRIAHQKKEASISPHF